MMSSKNMIKQIVDFNKAAVDNFKGFLQFQEQAEEQIKTLYDGIPYCPEACKKAMADYIVWHKDLHVKLIAMMDANLKNVENSLSA